MRGPLRPLPGGRDHARGSDLAPADPSGVPASSSWTVHVTPRERGDGLTQVVFRAGDHVGHVDERFADDYALVAEADAGAE